MKLFTKEIDKKLAAQYHLGSDLNAQVVVAKIFNPYGNGRWYLINSDPADPDYLWAIVQIGNIVEVGSVSRRELETLRVGRFGFPLERDLGFSQRNAQEVYNGVKGGKTYADGGVADEVTNYAVGGLTPGRWYKDNQGVEYKFIGKVDSGPNKDQLLFTDGEKKMYKNIDEFGEKPKENKLFGWFAKGGEVLKKYGFETIDDAVKALKNGEITTTKFMDILYEYEKKSKRKLEDGGYMADGGENLDLKNAVSEALKDGYLSAKYVQYDQRNVKSEDYFNSKYSSNKYKVEITEAWKNGFEKGTQEIMDQYEIDDDDYEYADGGLTKNVWVIFTREDYLKKPNIVEEFTATHATARKKLRKYQVPNIKETFFLTDKTTFEEMNEGKMADGGKVKFADKVKSIQTSLLKRKKVAPSVQKDYGKTYNKAEAKESATRIVGAMTSKERLMAKKKK